MLIDIGNISVTGRPKYQFWKIQDGGRRHLKKYTIGRISANSQPLCIKFGRLIDMANII